MTAAAETAARELMPSDRETPAVAFRAIGLAQPAGSKTSGVTKAGRPFTRPANAAKQRPWRSEVARAAADAMHGQPLLDGPLRLRTTFFRPRPKGHFRAMGGLSAAGLRNPYPASKPDGSKLQRSLEDALKGVVWRDDSQVVLWEGAKLWGEPACAMVEIYRMVVEA